jgi:hypothetical protein
MEVVPDAAASRSTPTSRAGRGGSPTGRGTEWSGSRPRMTRARRLFGRFHLAFTLLLGLAVWVGVVVLASRPQLRGLIDLSPQASFTLDEQTLTLLDRVADGDDVLEIDMFFQPPSGRPRTQLEQRQAGIALRVQELAKDLFEILDLRGGDDVIFRAHNLLLDSTIAEVRERAEEVNGEPDVVVLTLGNVQRKLRLYRDLAVIDVPRIAPIPGAQRQQQSMPILKSFEGEEAIASTLLTMLEYGNPKAYFVVGQSLSRKSMLANSSLGYTEFVGALEDDGFEVDFVEIGTNEEIPADADLVVLLEPTRELTEPAEETLWTYLRRGGRVLIDLQYVDEPSDWNPRFPGLLGRLGLRIGDELLCTAVVSPDGRNLFGGERARAVPGVPSPVHPITRPLAQTQRTPVFYDCRALFPVEPTEEGVSTDVGLLRTKPFSWLAPRIGAGRVDLTPPATQSAMQPFTIAAITEVESAEKGDRDGVALILSGRCLVNAVFRPNGDFALNAANQLADRRERITVRADRYVSKSLAITDPQLTNVRRLLVFYVPGSLLLLGIAMFVWRNRN